MNLIVNLNDDQNNDKKVRKDNVARADEDTKWLAFLCDKEKRSGERKNGYLTDLVTSKLAAPLVLPGKYIVYVDAPVSSTDEFLRRYLQWLGRVQSQVSVAKTSQSLFRRLLWIVSADYRDKEVAVLGFDPNNKGPYVMRQTSESTRLSSDFTVQPSGTKCKGVSDICSPVSCHACIINIIIKQAYKKHVTLCGHV